MNKSGLQLSVSAIVVLILAIAFLALGLGFIRGMFEKTSTNLEEQILREPEPAAADANTPVTLSRKTIISYAGESEVIKVDIFNPTNKDWVFRDAVTLRENLCGRNGDGVCFIDVANLNCDNKNDDSDCKNEYDCTQNSELGEGIGCVIVKGNKRLFCPEDDISCDCDVDGYGIGHDPDCDPTEGVRLKVECSERLKLEKITNPKEVKTGSSTQFTALLNIDKKAEKGSYLCKIGIEGFITGAEKYEEDLLIKID